LANTTSLLHLPLLPKDTTRFMNALATRFASFSLVLDTGAESSSAAVSLSLLMQAPRFESVFSLYVNMNGLWRLDFGNLDFLTVRPEFASWLEENPSNSFSLLPKALLRSVLERLFLTSLDDLSRKLNLPAFFTNKPRQSSSSNFTEQICFLLKVDSEHSTSTPVSLIWQDSATLISVVEYLESLPLAKKVLPVSANASVMAVPVLGRMQLTKNEIQSLMCGDILLCPQISKNPCLEIGSFRFSCTVEGSNLCVQDRISATAEGDTMSQENPLVEPQQLEKLELDVTFALPGIKLTLAECSKLAAGTTFTLGSDIENLQVQVLVGGQLAAFGRLVDVSGTVGVQLMQVQKTDLQN